MTTANTDNKECNCDDYKELGWCSCNDEIITTNSCNINDPTCPSCDG